MLLKRSILVLFLIYCTVNLIDCKRNSLVELDETNWTDILNGEWMVAL